MLRSFPFHIRNQRPVVCRRCHDLMNLIPLGRRTHPRRLLSNSNHKKAEVQQTFSTFQGEVPPPNSEPKDIRASLRRWDVENSTPAFVSKLREVVDDVGGEYGVKLEHDHYYMEEEIFNSRRTRGVTVPESNKVLTNLDISNLESKKLLDIGNKRTFLQPGDLVELTSAGGSRNLLAIYIRQLETQGQFYTIEGQCVHIMRPKVYFFVQDFAQQDDMKDLIPLLPTSELSAAARMLPEELELRISRTSGKILLQKMHAFLTKANKVYQANSLVLDNAHATIATGSQMSYRTLDEIVRHIVPATSIEKNADGKYEEHVLYAVHRAMLFDEVYFRAQRAGELRGGAQYEISSGGEVKVIRKIKELVRIHKGIEIARFKETSPGSGQVFNATAIENFAKIARRLIGKSRETRAFTPYGTLSTYSETTENGFRSGRRREPFQYKACPEFQTFIEFFELWTTLSNFSSQSQLRGLGSVILRCIQCYEDVELDDTTAFTFLQEIGVIPPWASRSPYLVRMEGTAGWMLPHPPKSNQIQGFTDDKLAYLRKDWGDLPVYCIDDPSAIEIDDGISVEKADQQGEYWIHTHVADPAAHIDVDSQAARIAEDRFQSIYMPEEVLPMLPTEFFRDSISLAPGRPCITFSAKLNLVGDLLEHKVSLGRLHNVVYLTPDTVERTISNTSATSHPQKTLQVGPDVPMMQPSRPMLKDNEILLQHRSDLELIHQLGSARSKQYRNKGGVPSVAALSSALSVSFDTPAGKPQRPKYSLSYPGDPTVKITLIEETQVKPTIKVNTVQQIMLLAGEVAAQWCHERGIPIPFRITPHNPEIQPYDFFLRNVLPNMDEHGNPDMSQIYAYSNLIGKAQPFISPGPHATIGVDMYTRATSPLRRFADLLLHWQVEAALVEEARIGQTLVGNTKDDLFPFSRARVEALLPHLNTKERLLKLGNIRANQHWLCYFLLRAWHFGEARLPATFSFTVRRFDKINGGFRGVLTAFASPVNCSAPDWSGSEDIKIGDILKVEIENINLASDMITVKPVMLLKSV